MWHGNGPIHSFFYAPNDSADDQRVLRQLESGARMRLQECRSALWPDPVYRTVWHPHLVGYASQNGFTILSTYLCTY